MKRLSLTLLFVLALLALSSPGVIAAASEAAVSWSSECARVLVKFHPGTPDAAMAEAHERAGARVVDVIPQIGLQVIEVPAGAVHHALEKYRADPHVQYAEQDEEVRLALSPNDPYYTSWPQWALTKIQAPQAWDISMGDPGVVIAILDSGIDLDHPDLASKIVVSKNFTSSPTAYDNYDHGTHVAGTAAAITDNGIGVAGLAGKASLMNVKVISDGGLGTFSKIVEAIIWAADNGADVINMSFITSGWQAMDDAINYAWSKGVVLVGAAGNDANNLPTSPAGKENCIAVAATDWWDNLASFSNYGDWVDVAAPGTGICSTVPGGYNGKSGTSMAAPHVAGLAALLLSIAYDANGNGFLNDEVRYAIETTCDDIGIAGIGHGRINAYAALSSITPPDSPLAEFTQTPVSGSEPLAVAFTDQSYSYDGIVSWLWDFGDGSTSTLQDPVHEYIQDGIYTVSLTVTEADGSSATVTKTDYIVVEDTGPSADFSASPVSGTAPLEVSFTDLSTSYDGIVSWAWDFGDGGTSTAHNPDHQYLSSGSYTVTLTVTEADGSTDTMVRSSYIAVSVSGPSANFSVSGSTGTEPLTVNFTDLSTSADAIVSWLWDFGDGATSTLQNPSHQYLQDGSSTVTLTVTDSGGASSTLVRTDYIVVTDTVPAAGFSATPLSGLEPLTVTFTDSSTSYDGIVSWLWDFGDGTTSTLQNSSHQYLQDGSYTVILTVTEADGSSDTLTRSSYISVTDSGPVPDFSAGPAPDGSGTTGSAVLLQAMVIAAGASTVQTGDGSIAIRFPGNSLTADGMVTIWQVSKNAGPACPDGFRSAGTSFHVELSAGLAPGAKVLVTVRYTEADLAACGGDPDRLVLSRYDEKTGEWVILPTLVNTETMTLSAFADRFSQWTMLAEAPATSPVPMNVGIPIAIFLTASLVLCVVLRRRQAHAC